MRCPQCHTENRDDQDVCYHCGQEMGLLRLVVSRARNHFNAALEHAERDRLGEAIIELEHTLELDASFVDAWMVLGTLRARQGQLEEAQRCWAKALSLDHRFEKCHNYLVKAQAIAPALPALRRLRRLTLGLAVVTLALAVGLGALAIRRRNGSPIEAALDLRGQGRPAEARQLLAAFVADSASPPEEQRRARHLAGLWEEEISVGLERSRERIEREELLPARETLAALRALEPSEATLETVAALEARLRERALAAARGALDRYRAREEALETLEGRLAEYAAIVAGDPGPAEEIERLAQAARDEERGRRLEGFRTELAAAPTIGAAARAAAEATERYPALADEIAGLLRLRGEAMAETSIDQAQGLLERGDLDGVRRVLTELTESFERAEIPLPEGRLEPLEERLQGADWSARLEAVRQAYAEGQWEATIERAEAAAAARPGEPMPVAIATAVEEARRRLADQLWRWANARDPQIEMLALEVEEAQRIVRWHELVIEAAGDREPFKRRQMVFYAAAAALRLGQVETSRRLLDQVLQGGPSAYFRRTVEAFRRRHADRLGLAQPS